MSTKEALSRNRWFLITLLPLVENRGLDWDELVYADSRGKIFAPAGVLHILSSTLANVFLFLDVILFGERYNRREPRAGE